MSKTKEIMEEIESMQELNDGSLFINAEKYIDHVTYLLGELNATHKKRDNRPPCFQMSLDV